MPPQPEPENETKANSSDVRIDNMEKYLQSLASTVSTLHDAVKGVPSIQASLKCLETQVGQLGTSLGEMQKSKIKDMLPSQPEHVNAISVLRSGRKVDNHVEMPKENEVEETLVEEEDEPIEDIEVSKSKTNVDEGVGKEKLKMEAREGLHKTATPYKPPVPYPSHLHNTKKERQFKDLYNMLSKVNVNLPLLDVIKNVSAYEQFFKDLASKKRRFEDNEKVMISEVASTTTPRKECDPGAFVMGITFGNGKATTGMLDLGAGINLMPYSIYKHLGLQGLKPTRMCLQLADQTLRQPKGIIEDVLVKVGSIVVPADFVVVDVGDIPNTEKEHIILLGRPFMATTNTHIDVKDGRVTLSAHGETATFTMNNAREAPPKVGQCLFVEDIYKKVHPNSHSKFSNYNGVGEKKKVKGSGINVDDEFVVKFELSM
ncbi:DNA-directed RNA polymerase subunit beta' [Striga asiatica]|uniref:DNA-directed RNA polymerase subunit beta n=1 Tax=Striga asiatica TaxID=4170 RepID=A0A5A7Q7Q8_STRAF|nr:DNA-directed RNA polymerase subunit beta' [Striga asiatica]